MGLYALNRTLLDGEAALDWRDVEVANRPAFDTLLAGTDPARPPARLDLDTLPEGLKDRLAAYSNERVQPAPFTNQAPARIWCICVSGNRRQA